MGSDYESELELDYEEPDFQSLQPNAQSTLIGSQDSQKVLSQASSSKPSASKPPDKKQPSPKKSSKRSKPGKSSKKVPLQPISQKYIAPLEEQELPLASNSEEQEPQLSDVSSLTEEPPNPGDVQQILNGHEQEQIEETEWEVEEVLDCRSNPETGEIEYLLAWKNWNGPNTWEPKSQCDCEDLIVAFINRDAEKQSSAKSRVKVESPPRKKMAHGPIAQKELPIPGFGEKPQQSIELITLSSSEEDEIDRDGHTPNGLKQKNLSDSESESASDSDSDSTKNSDKDYGSPMNVDYVPSLEEKPKPLNDITKPKVLSKNSQDKNFNVKPKISPTSPVVSPPPPPPPHPGTRFNTEQGYKTLLERRLNLDRIVGTTDNPEKYVIVKWQNIPNYEKVPIDIFRQFWPQELLDYLIRHIEFE